MEEFFNQLDSLKAIIEEDKPFNPDFTYDKGNSTPLHHYTMADISDGSRLAGILNVIFLELTKLPKIEDEADISVLPAAIKWGTFLKEADNPVSQDLIDSITESEEGIMNAEVVLAALSDDRWRWIEQGRIDGDRRDIADGLRRSKEEGINEAKIANARNIVASIAQKRQVLYFACHDSRRIQKDSE